MAAEELVLELPHLRLAALAWGPAEGLPLLALHGWLDNAASFARLAPLLEGVRFVALDLPGHGHSEHRPAGATLHFVDWVGDVLAAIDALGWEELVLLGHSMGAGIASLIPACVGRRVQRLVLIEGLGPLSTSADNAPRRLTRALEGDSRPRPRRRSYPSVDAAIRARAKGTELDPASAAILVERALEQVSDGFRFRHDTRLKQPSRLRLTEDQVLAFFAGIRCPVLAFLASDGWPYPAMEARSRAAALVDLEQHEVAGGHHVHLTHPERLAPAISRFLAGRSTTAP